MIKHDTIHPFHTIHMMRHTNTSFTKFLNGNKCLALLTFIFLLLPQAWAYDFMAGGIYYNILSKKDNTVSVTYKNPRAAAQYTPSSYKGNVVIPASVTYKGVKYTVVEIGKRAFGFADKLTNVTIPNTVRSIRFDAFTCTSLTSLHIPASVVKIEAGFMMTSSKMKTLTIASNNPYYKAVKNVMFNKDMTRLIYCTPAKRNAYTVPSSVRRIENAAFCDCVITKLKIPSSVKVFVGDPFTALDCKKFISKATPKHIPIYKGQKCPHPRPTVIYSK